MSISLSSAKEYVARIVGGKNDDNTILLAADAIRAALEELNYRHTWSAFRQDTSQSRIVACSSASSVTVTTAVVGGFAGLFEGMDVTHADVPAGTTIASVDSASSLTLSAATTGSSSAEDFTFSGDFDFAADEDTKVLPYHFWRPYEARLVSGGFHRLNYIPQKNVDRVTTQVVSGPVTHYTVYKSNDFDANGIQQKKIKVFRPAQAASTVRLRYYRFPMELLDPLDFDDRFLYMMLDLARVHLLELKDSDRPGASAHYRMLVEKRVKQAINADLDEGNEGYDASMITPNEVRPGSNGLFYPRGDDGQGFYW
jgi:hypothetical protein